MKFDCGPSWNEKRLAREQWHRWFAWFPVKVGERDCRWFEFVERKGAYYFTLYESGWDWEYRALK